jgi:hypothetical protein
MGKMGYFIMCAKCTFCVVVDKDIRRLSSFVLGIITK